MKIRALVLTGVLTGCVAGVAAWFVFAERGDRDRPAPEPIAAEAPEPVHRDGDLATAGFAITSASWGAVDDTRPTIPEPTGKTEDQLRREAFAKEAAERWKGTEIFVQEGRVKTADDRREEDK